MKIACTILFAFVCLTTTYAQNTLSGKVTDLQNNPLPGVEIISASLHKGTTTDFNGNYQFNNLPNGTVTVSFIYIGFQKVVRTITFKDKPQQLNMQLKESVFSLDEVVISTPFNKLQSENVMKVAKISAAGLKKTGTTTLIDGLATMSGVSQISTGASIGKPVIRGLSGNRVLVYTQGVRLENQQFGDEHGLGINDEGISSVEIIKGPASLLYGSDALGGVIYITPEKFALENESSLGFHQRFFSNTLGSNSSVVSKISGNKWKFLARGTTNSHSDYKIPTGKRVTNTRFKEDDLKFGIGFNSTNYSSELRYNFNRLQLGIPENGIAAQTTSTSPDFPRQKVYNHILSLHNHFILGDSKLDADFGYIFNDRSEFENTNVANLRMKLGTFSYNAKYHFPKLSNGIETIVGIQGMHQTNKNLGDEILIPDATINDFGVLGTANYQWGTSTLQAGIRFDSRGLTTKKHVITDGTTTTTFNPLDKNFTSFTASAGYKFEPFEQFTTRINIASGFRAPNLAELSSNGIHEGTNRYEIGNKNLKTEKNLQIDLDLSYRTEHVEFFASPFYNNMSDYIYLSPTGNTKNGAPEYQYSQNNAKLYGGEFGFHLHPHPIDWLHLESSFEMVVGKQQSGGYLPLIPAHIFKNKISTSFDINKWFKNGYASLSYNITLAQENVSQFETNSPGYSLVNLGFGGDVQLDKFKFHTSLAISNLTNKKYINHLSRLKVDGILNSGRNFVMGISFSI